MLFEFGYHWGKRYEGNPEYWIPKLSNPSDSDVRHPFAKYGGDKEYIPMPPLSGRIVVRLFICLPLSLKAHSIQATYSIRAGLFTSACSVKVDQERRT